jgi:hypothetical protein
VRPNKKLSSRQGIVPIVGVVGENVRAGPFDLRVLDYLVTDHTIV